METVSADIATALRERKGRQVRLLVHPGAEELSGHLRGLLESADGLVAFVVDGTGRLHTLHYQQIREVHDTPA